MPDDVAGLSKEIRILKSQLRMMQRSAPKPHVTEAKGLSLVKKDIAKANPSELNDLQLSVYDDGTNKQLAIRVRGDLYKVDLTKL